MGRMSGAFASVRSAGRVRCGTRWFVKSTLYNFQFPTPLYAGQGSSGEHLLQNCQNMFKCRRRELPKFFNHTFTIDCANLIQNDMACATLKLA